jgi:hypothetical protein
MIKTLEYASKEEARACRKLISLALSKGYLISVNDGEEWTVKKSNKASEILEALCSTGQDTLLFRDAEGNRLGVFDLVWGNSDEELVADYSANEAMDNLFNEWQAEAF